MTVPVESNTALSSPYLKTKTGGCVDSSTDVGGEIALFKPRFCFLLAV